jgi:hypothetical protein
MTTTLPVELTGPISGWITICVAFDTFHLSCHEVPPRWLAVKLITGLSAVVCGGGAGAETRIIADDLITVPVELVALMV